MTGRNAQGLLVALAFTAAALLFWQFRVIAPATEPEGFFQTDFYSLLYPMYHYGYGEMLAGRVPLWNPYTLAGLPFLATLYTGILYPGNFLFLLLPTALAMGMTAALHSFLTTWFMYLLGREWGWSRIAAGVAALAWAYSHNSVWFYGPLCFIASAAWLPLMLLGVHRATEAGRGRSGSALLAFAGAMSLLAGGFQIFVYGVYALAAFALLRLAGTLRSNGRGAALRAAAWLLLGSLTAAAFAAPQILPTAELSRLTERSIRGLPFEWVGNPMQPESPLSDEQATGLTVVAPTAQVKSLFARAVTALADLRTLTPRRIPALYFGILPPLLAVAAFFGARWRAALAVSAGGLLALLLSMGPHFPLYRVYYALPTGDWFRNANRFVLLSSLALAALVGMGFASLEASPAGRRRGLRAALVAAILSILVLWLAGVPARPFLWSSGTAALGLLLAAVATARHPRLRRAAGLGILLFVFTEFWLAYANPHYHPQKNPQVFDEHGVMTAYLRDNLGNDRIVIVDNPWGSWGIQPKYGLLHRLHTLNDYEPLVPLRYKFAFSLLENAPSDNVAPFDARLRLDPARSNKTVLDMLAVRFVVVDRDLYPAWDAGAATFGLRRISLPDRQVSLYVNASARPRAALIPRAVAAASEREATSTIRDPAFDPEKIVVIEPGGPEPPGTAAAAPLLSIPRWRQEAPLTGLPMGGEVRFLRDDADQIEIEARVPPGAPAWLVLMDLPYPGWRATVDGNPAAIRPANLVGRAVAVPPGIHRVVFSYASRPFRIGCWLFLAAAISWLGVALWNGTSSEGERLKQAARRLIPWAVAAAILWALFARTGFAGVKDAAREANLLLLFGATVLCTLPMYVLDVLSLSRVIGWFNRPVAFMDLARVKAAAYLITLVNYNVGSGGIAFWLKRRHGVPFLEAMASILFINVVDVMVLVGLLAITLPALDAPVNRAVGGVVGAAVVVFAGHFIYWRAGFDFLFLGRLRRWPIFKSFSMAGAGHYLKLAAIRLPFDLLFILNFWIALIAFDVKAPLGVTLAYVPIILFVSVVPITVAGLGTVQAVTLYLFRDYGSEATLLAFSLMLTVALSAVRALLGLPVFRKVSVESFSGGNVTQPDRG
ncbi:MAG: lysylphosphatidylglycerol synthase domain-containing protein [Deltaproteobacteria bacterium]|nr:lysylphosphatidylglycerol synthase domain-containing protein [Deltaproteobacteria bacterium]